MLISYTRLQELPIKYHSPAQLCKYLAMRGGKQDLCFECTKTLLPMERVFENDNQLEETFTELEKYSGGLQHGVSAPANTRGLLNLVTTLMLSPQRVSS